MRRAAGVLSLAGVAALLLMPTPAYAQSQLQAVDDTATVGAAQQVATGNVLSNDIGPDGEPATPGTVGVVTTPVSGPARGDVVISSDGGFRYEPEPCFVGDVVFRYRIVNPEETSETSEANVTVTIQAGASPPLARNDSVRANSAGVAQGNVLANDCGPGPQATGGSVLLTGPLSGPSKGDVALNAGTGAFTYVAEAGARGTDSFTYQIANRIDPTLTSQATVRITIPARDPSAPPPSIAPPPDLTPPGGGGGGDEPGGQPGVQPPPGLAAPGEPDPLPATGANRVGPATAIGAGLLVLGAAVLAASRIRRRGPAATTDGSGAGADD
jgi:Bacterial Ig domain